MKKLETLLCAALFLTGCVPVPPARDHVQSPAANSQAARAPSGFEFPESFGKFRRVAVNFDDATGQNVSANYILDDGDNLHIALTLHIFPAPPTNSPAAPSFRELFNIQEADLLENHPVGLCDAPQAAPKTENGETIPGMFVSCRYEDGFLGRWQPLGSLLYLYEYNGWMIEYHFTYPAAVENGATLIAQTFVSTFRWRAGQ